MSEAYSVYWPQPRWRHAACVGQRLAVLLGGPHTSEPSFRRATVQPGDLLYPIGVCDQVLYVLGRMRVRQIVPADEGRDDLLQEYFARYSAWRFLAPTCTTEVVIGCEGTGVLLDRPLPGEILKRLTYRPRRGPRPVRHVSDDGRLVHDDGQRAERRPQAAAAADRRARIRIGTASSPRDAVRRSGNRPASRRQRSPAHFWTMMNWRIASIP